MAGLQVETLVYAIGAALSIVGPVAALVAIHRWRHCPRPRARLRRTGYLAAATTVLTAVGSTALVGGAMSGKDATPAALAAAASGLLPALTLLEELSRFVVLLGYSLRPRAQATAVNGIAYGLAAGLAFTLLESAVTMAGSAAHSPAAGWIRFALATPAHALLGGVMGYLIARGRMAESGGWWWMALALLVPTALHFAYDAPIILTLRGAGTATMAGAIAAFAFNAAIVVAMAVAVRRLFRASSAPAASPASSRTPPAT